MNCVKILLVFCLSLPFISSVYAIDENVDGSASAEQDNEKRAVPTEQDAAPLDQANSSNDEVPNLGDNELFQKVVVEGNPPE